MRQIADTIDQGAPVYSLSRLSSLDEGAASLEQLWQRIMLPPWQRFRFLFLNAYLMDVDVDDWFGDFSRGSKPRVGARAKEIGSFVRDRYDLAALCEVWTDDEKGPLLKQWPETPPHVHRITRRIQWDKPREAFQREENSKGSSGLLTISQKMQIVGQQFEEYKHESGAAESKADKGALLTTLDTGIGASRLQLYNTHLQSADKQVAMKQAIQLAKFILETRGDQNAAILVGDFNLKADDTERFSMQEIADVKFSIPDLIRQAIFGEVQDGRLTGAAKGSKTGYELLCDVLGILGFQDLWAARNGTPGYTSGVTRPGVMPHICSPDPHHPGYCMDSFAPSSGLQSARIDYIFVSPSASGQSFRLEFTRPRRLRLERAADAPGKDEIAFLSDHIGLETTLLIAPK